jgi:hypothetical protein
VREEVLNCEFASGGDGVEEGRHAAVWCGGARGPVFYHRNFHGFELRDEPGNRIGQAKFAFLHHHQHGCADYRLGHRHHPEQRVFGHRLLGFDIRQAVRFEVRHLAVSGDEGHGARDVMRVHVPLHHFVDAGQTPGRETGLFRFRGLDRRRQRR